MTSALAIHNNRPAPPPAPRGVGYIDLATCAKRWGCKVDSFRKRQLPKFIANGFARPRADGRTWEVREDAKLELTAVRFPEDIRADLRTLSDAERNRVRCKIDILQEWKRFSSDASVRTLPRGRVDSYFIELLAAGRFPVKLAPGMKLPSDRTLRSWRQAFRRDGKAGLVDERSTRQRKPVGDDPFFACFESYYLTQQQRTIQLCWELACEKSAAAGLMSRSYPQTKRYANRIPQNVLIHARRGERRFNGTGAAYIQRDYSKLRSNEIWCSDHHQFDVWVIHNGKPVRPWLTAFEDVRSRKIVGWHISPAAGNTDTILRALRRGIQSHGVPEGFQFDCGKDFEAAAIQGLTKRQRRGKMVVDQSRIASVCTTLNISVTHALPYNAKSKPIERFFKTAEERFGKLQPTYCGNSPANKPENLKAKLARGAAPKLEDFADAFALWLEGDYHCRKHTGDAMDGRTPQQVFDACLETKRVMSEVELAITLWKPRTVKVGRVGVRCGGFYYGHSELPLIRRMGEELIVRADPDDARRVAVCELNGAFICMAESNDRIGFKASNEAVNAAIAKQKRYTRVVKEYHRIRPQLYEDIPGIMHQQRAEEAKRERDAAALAAAPVELVKTPMADQLPLLQRAMEQSQPDQPAAARQRSFSIYDNPPGPEPARQRQYPSLAEMMQLSDERDREQRERQAREELDQFESLGELMRKAASNG